MITEPQTRPAALARRTNPAYALLAAVQFLTRIPTPQIPYTDRTLSDALAYFPLIGLLIGTLAALVNQFLAPHLSRPLSALCTVTFTVLITGALHEDGLADCADAFFGHHSRERTLAILRDSRIGTYGAAALALSLGARVLLVAALPLNHVFPYLIAAHTLARWSPLPLSYLPPARPENGQGARVAQRTSWFTMVQSVVICGAIVVFSLHRNAAIPIAVTLLTTTACAAYLNHRIHGITGDCFGTTTQLVEIAVLTAGAWI